MKHLKNLCVALTVILGIAFAYSLVIISRQSRQLTNYESQQAKNVKSIHQLQKALHEEHLEKTHIEVTGRSSKEKLQAVLNQRMAALKATQSQLGAAEAQASNLRSQLSDSKEKYQEALAKANDQIGQEKSQIKAQLDLFKKQMNSARTNLQAARLRVQAVEAQNAKLRKEQVTRSAQTAGLTDLLHQLQNLERRREAYLNSVMSHYQNISSQLQAMQGMLDANRDGNSNVFSNQALYRIRDTMSLANNDLRQLNNLNGQIRQLEKNLGKK